MTNPDDITEDRSLKALFTEYAFETLEVFAPKLLAERGRPIRIIAVQQEVPLPDLGDPSRFLDLALLATWADGYRAVILLIEHWSEARKVDLVRVLWYYVALRLKHPDSDVYPMILVTDRTAATVQGHLESFIAGEKILEFNAKVVQISPEDRPRLEAIVNNRVAATLLTLAIRDAVDATLAAMLAMRRSPGPFDDLPRFLPLLQKLARMRDSDEPRFRRAIREEPTMGNVLEEIINEAKALGEARGKAEGKAEGKIAEIRHLVSKGRLSVDAARAEIEDLIATQAVPEALGREALGLLG